MKTSDFDYFLAADRIAAEPLERRDESRLMQIDRRGGEKEPEIKHTKFRYLPSLLPPDSVLVLNDTQVLPARLRGRKPTGGAIELLLIRRVEGIDPATQGVARRHFGARDPVRQNAEHWEAIGRNLAGIATGTEWTFRAGETEPLVAELTHRGDAGAVRVCLRPPPGETVLGMLDKVGEVPLPPYVESARREIALREIARRESVPREPTPSDLREGGRAGGAPISSASDRERYQTVYAAHPGAVAAPTAGLHFTEDLLARIAAAGHQIVKLTLHVGLGTFRPVQVDDLDDHLMEAETYTIAPETAAAVEDARRRGRPVVAVGTTVVRALETAVRAGEGVVRPGTAESRLFLRPGDRFDVVTDLVTNFHLPRSTLLMLVSAFAGRERVLAAYQEAIAHGYRFYSYGDAMWIRGSR